MVKVGNSNVGSAAATAATSTLLSGLGFSLNRFLFGLGTVFAVAYFLFQKKLLPLPIAKVVSKILFYPTFPITALLRLGNYWTKVDDTLYLGCAPMGFLQHPQTLAKLGVKGVINMCYEYPGPKAAYQQVGIQQLHLPTVDHTEPSIECLKDAVAFIKQHQLRKEKVYVHCKAGHGRAASVALSWLISENPDKSVKDLNAALKSKRKVRGTLFEQSNIKSFKKFIDATQASSNSAESTATAPTVSTTTSSSQTQD